MSGIFSTFNTAKRGIFAQQHAINTTSHNVSNAGTEGYSRQRVQLETTPGFSMPGIGMVGTGVQVSMITRIRDSYLDAQIRYESSIAGQYKARQEVLEQVEMIFLEPSDAGLNTILGRMWDSWQELGKSPENSNARTIVRDNAVTFTDNLNHMYDQLDTLKNDTINLAEKKALDIHSVLDQVKSLNEQIYKVVIKGDKPNDLMDKRDLLMDQLSEIVDYKATEDQYGRVTIESGGKTLLGTVRGNEIPQEISVVRKIEIEGDNVQVTLVRGGDSINGVTTLSMTKDQYENNYSFLKEGNVVFNANAKDWDGSLENSSSAKLGSFDMAHGELRGYQAIIQEVEKYQGELDGLARAVAYAVNTLHQDNGEELDGHIAFFVGEGNSADLSNISAKNITVNKDIIDDVRLINTGKSIDSEAGDGERALAIAQLRNARLPVQDFIDASEESLEKTMGSITYDKEKMQFENKSGDTTFESYFKDMTAKLGISAQQANRMVDNQYALTSQLLQRRDSISGVSLDEEIANLVQFQHAYAANSKVISTLTMMLDTLINGMGI